MHIYLHVCQGKYSLQSHKAKQTSFSHSGCIKMLMQAHSSGMDTSALYNMRVWFGFACYAKDVSKVGTLSSTLTKPKLK